MRLLRSLQYKVWLVILFFLAFYVGHAQTKILKGIIRDAHSGERVPFASMRFKKAGTGKLSDSAGTFLFRFEDSWPKDTLEISYVGFTNYEIPFSDSVIQRSHNDTLYISVLLERGKYVNEVVVKAK